MKYRKVQTIPVVMYSVIVTDYNDDAPDTQELCPPVASVEVADKIMQAFYDQYDTKEAYINSGPLKRPLRIRSGSIAEGGGWILERATVGDDGTLHWEQLREPTSKPIRFKSGLVDSNLYMPLPDGAASVARVPSPVLAFQVPRASTIISCSFALADGNTILRWNAGGPIDGVIVNAGDIIEVKVTPCKPPEVPLAQAKVIEMKEGEVQRLREQLQEAQANLAWWRRWGLASPEAPRWKGEH